MIAQKNSVTMGKVQAKSGASLKREDQKMVWLQVC